MSVDLVETWYDKNGKSWTEKRGTWWNDPKEAVSGAMSDSSLFARSKSASGFSIWEAQGTDGRSRSVISSGENRRFHNNF